MDPKKKEGTDVVTPSAVAAVATQGLEPTPASPSTAKKSKIHLHPVESADIASLEAQVEQY